MRKILMPIVFILTFVLVYDRLERKRIKAWYDAGLIEEFIRTL
jgi:hypothetical protein